MRVYHDSELRKLNICAKTGRKKKVKLLLFSQDTKCKTKDALLKCSQFTEEIFLYVYMFKIKKDQA